MRKKTHEEFIIDLKQKNPNNVKIVGKYTTARNPIEWECSQCGKHCFSSPRHIYDSTGLCKDCITKNIAQNTIQKSKDVFLKDLKKRKNAPVLLEEYKGMLVPIKVQCSVCGHIWDAAPNNLKKYSKPCPKCAVESQTKKHSVFIDELKSINPNIEIQGKYKSALSLVKCKCLLCGHIWRQKPNALLNGIGCPKCNHTSTSFIEQVILLALKKTFPEKTVISRNKSVIGQELDIYIPDDQVAIEYGAWHWHKDKLSDDNEKIKKCREKGIRLITIYDSCKTNPFETIPDDVLFYKSALGRNLEDAKSMLKTLYSILGYEKFPSDEEYETIVSDAYIHSRKITTEEFKKRMKGINPSIEIIGEYKGSQKKMSLSCL